MQPLLIDGKEVVMILEIGVSKGQVIRVELLSDVKYPRQGIGFSVDRQKEYVKIEGEIFKYPALFHDAPPDSVSIVCYPKQDTGIFRIWNVWQYEENGRIDAWLGNCGMIVEQPDANTYILHGSCGYGEADFTDWTVRVSVAAP